MSLFFTLNCKSCFEASGANIKFKGSPLREPRFVRRSQSDVSWRGVHNGVWTLVQLRTNMYVLLCQPRFHLLPFRKSHWLVRVSCIYDLLVVGLSYIHLSMSE